MLGHKYQIGQEVRFQPFRHQAGSPPEVYVIVRLLPAEEGYPLYHITEKASGIQRVVREGQISPYDATANLAS